ncbi:MAG TPA: phosphohydrolase [Candidatus Nanoarchaeia archaeon]|nr:phosphohydrolase [Candidatus Nanoarchaeia archaeon]
MTNPDVKGLENFIVNLLRRDLNKDLFYHNVDHPLDVRDEALVLAKMEGLHDYEIFALEPAALTHDLGFLVRYKDNEEVGEILAQEYLPQFGYDQNQSQFISEMIPSTKMPQKPKTHIDKILCDADLANLGREDFYIKTELLRRELSTMGIQNFSPRQWYEGTLKLLEDHTYWTKSARNLWQPTKERHIIEIKQLLGDRSLPYGEYDC